MSQRNISISRTSRHKTLHVEAPGCIINITVGLSDDDGREVTRIAVSADGDRYAGDPQWWIDGTKSQNGHAVRVICTGREG